MTNSAIGVLCLVGCLLGAPGFSNGAAAQQPVTYGEVVREGLSEFDSGRWIEAYSLFRRAHGLSPNARTLRGMGMTSYEMGEYPRALRELEAALASQEKSLDGELRSHVQGLIGRASRLVGTLEVTLIPAQALLQVDDELTELRTIVVRTGKVALRARLDGYHVERRVVSVDSGQSYAITMKLIPLDGSASVAPTAIDEPKSSTDSGITRVDLKLAGGSGDARDDGGLFSSPWLWVGIGVVVAAAVVGGIVLSAEGDDTSAGAGTPDGVVATWETLGQDAQ